MQQWLAASLAVFVPVPVTLAVDGQSFKASDEEADRNWAAVDFGTCLRVKRVKRLVHLGTLVSHMIAGKWMFFPAICGSNRL